MRFVLGLVLLIVLGLPAYAEDLTLTIKDHRIEPSELHVPAGKELSITVSNQDATAEEFESNDLDVEKVIAGNQSAVIKVGPLDAGKYEFYGEYHEDTAKGVLVVE